MARVAVGLAVVAAGVAWPQIPAVEGTPVERAVLRSIEIRTGTGEAALPGQEYTVHYTGWLSATGKKFDSSRDRNEPLRFIQGRRQVIPGYDAGFEGMRVGGQRRLIIPYQLAYGEKGRGAIPPKAELVFDVELVAVRAVEDEVAARGFLTALSTYEKQILALAREIPEEKLAWRPAPAVRTVREVLAHIADGNRELTALAAGQPAAADAGLAPQTRAELVATLEASFAAARQQATPLRPAQLSREVTAFGEKTTVQGVHTMLVSHAAGHLGQLIVYARMLGITPPWSN